MYFKSLPGSLWAWLRQTRCKYLLLLTLLCLLFRENYPFSHFPMFSSFSKHSHYIYLSDASGRVLRTREFGRSASDLTKIFDRYRRTELKHFANSGTARTFLAEEAAGKSLLNYLTGLPPNPRTRKLLDGLEIKHIAMRQENGELLLETKTLAKHP
jgi:hypothetical protein